MKASPFAASVALAGHTLLGSWCECGTPGCLCGPGEESRGQRANWVSDQDDTSSDQGAPVSSDPNLDFGSGALMLLFALFVWTRLRA